MDLDTNAWSETILSAADLPAEALPQLQPSTAAWTVRASAAARFGLSPQARVVLGGMDNCCSLLGASDPSEPRLVNTVGTYEHLGGTGGLDVARTAAEAADGVVHTYLLPGRYLSMTRVPMGHLLARVADASSLPLDQLLDGVSDEPAGLDMRLAGDAVQDALDDGTSPAVVIQTLLESAAAHLMRFADSWDGATGVRSDQFVAVGGGAGRANLMQLKANLLGRSLSTLASDESAGLGALRLAAMAVRGATPSAACELFPNPIVHTWSPDAPRKDRASAAVDAGDAGLD
jgi:xylulokinase